MKLTRFTALIAGVFALGACDKTGTDAVLANIPPLAYTRFINAVGDTSAIDARFIDQIEYSPIVLGMAFRGFSPYQGTAPGARKFRIFPTSNNIAVTQNFLKDTTLTFEAGKYYTIIYAGYARTGSSPSHRIIVMEDAIPASVAATNFATRVVNLGTGLPAIDAYSVATASTSITGLTPMFTNIAWGNASAYNSASATTASMAFRVTDTGTQTIEASALAPAGSPADALNNLTAIAGTTTGSSAFSAYYFPRSVAGTSAPQTAAFQVPAILYLYDRNPR